MIWDYGSWVSVHNQSCEVKEKRSLEWLCGSFWTVSMGWNTLQIWKFKAGKNSAHKIIEVFVMVPEFNTAFTGDNPDVMRNCKFGNISKLIGLLF